MSMVLPSRLIGQAKMLIDHYKPTIPVDVKSLATKLNVEILPIKDPYSEVIGRSYLEDDRAIIEYSSDMNIHRQRFTIAHHLGHLVLGHTNRNVSCSDVDYTDTDKQELDANVFAANILISPNSLRDMMSRMKPSNHSCNNIRKTVKILSEVYNVSESIVRWQLEEFYKQSLSYNSVTPTKMNPIEEDNLFYDTAPILAETALTIACGLLIN